MKHSTLESPLTALDAMLRRSQIVSEEILPWREACGRVLAENLYADQKLPACNTSMLDGYAVTASRVMPGRLAVSGTITPGVPPVRLSENTTIRIFTGGALPDQADAVIAREHVEEHHDFITIGDIRIEPGHGVRRCGESAMAGDLVVPRGQILGPTQMAALTACGQCRVPVRRRLRVAAIVTGNELVAADDHLPPWKVRDSNGPALATLFGQTAWIDWLGSHHVTDHSQEIRRAIVDTLSRCDVLLLTGGVSVGDYDYVPHVLAEVGAAQVFHRLPIRPGKPLQGAVGPAGQIIWGLPGNPLSTLVTARRFALPIMRRQAGLSQALDIPRPVRITNPDGRSIPLTWYRLVRSRADGEAELVSECNSADLAASATSDGFVEIPAAATGEGPWPYFSWKV